MEKVRSGRKRRGFMALSLLLGLTALLTVAGAALAVVSRTYRGTAVYQNGLPAVYGAESGANWGLAYLKSGAAENKSMAFDQPGARVEVDVTVDGTKAVVRSSARESGGVNRRFLTLECVRSGSGDDAVVTVRKVSANAFQRTGTGNGRVD